MNNKDKGYEGLLVDGDKKQINSNPEKLDKTVAETKRKMNIMVLENLIEEGKEHIVMISNCKVVLEMNGISDEQAKPVLNRKLEAEVKAWGIVKQIKDLLDNKK